MLAVEANVVPAATVVARGLAKLGLPRTFGNSRLATFISCGRSLASRLK
jgi:hypothetical protein